MKHRALLAACVVASACATVPFVRTGERTWMPAGSGPESFVPAGTSATDGPLSEPTFAPDGRTLLVQKSVDGRYTILESRFESGRWTPPRVAAFSGRFDDAMPCFRPDGRRLFFISRRPADATTSAARPDYDIWSVDRERIGWGSPRPLGPPINTGEYEVGDSTARNGNLYFAGFRPGTSGGLDIWVSRYVNGRYEIPANLPPAINGPGQESHPAVDPDERFLVFERYHGPESGRFTLWVSHRKDGRWLAAQQLGPQVNARLVTSHPKLSPDGKVLFWNSASEPAAKISVLMRARVSDVLPPISR